ncbi:MULTISPECIES: hypothetical protein [unclassified Aeromicrobium]|uniref:hypothetical protein n=1 Tax=unclassified Aeromicrobium TaxID=2633570 RepID=UPI0028890C3A|nr:MULTISPECIES: hypothetical protein [unclassified Aeromicrobium]
MRRLLLSLLALPLLLVGLAAPASAAAAITTFTVNGSTGSVDVEPDDDLTIAWAATGDEALTVTASGDWDGELDPSGTTAFPGPAAGQTFTFTLTANDGDDVPATQTITVTAEDDEPEGSTPPPVVVASCLVTVPESDDFTYELVYDGDPDDTEEIESGTYTVSELTADGLFEIEIVAVPGDGVVVAPGAPTSFEVPFSEECLRPALLEATGGQCSFEVENVSDATVTVLYGDPRAEDADDVFTLAAGQSRTVRTQRESLIVVGVEDVEDDDTGFQIIPLEVSQDGCGGEAAAGDSDGSGPRWPVPVNAPAAGVSAAGVTTGSGGAPWLLAGLVIAGGLAAGAVRRRAAS